MNSATLSVKRIIDFGIIGAGNIALTHAAALSNIPNAKLIAVADIFPETARRFAERYKVHYYYEDFLTLLKNKEVNVVSICTPHHTHEEIATQAAYFGKHILIEKPLATTLEAADNIITTCRNKNVKLGVIFQHRFSEAALRLKKIIQNRGLGKIIVGNVLVHWYRTQEYYDNAPWRASQFEAGGGVLMTQAIHFIDLLQWYMGPVKNTCAYTDTLTHNTEVEDTVVAILRFENGVLGTIETTVSSYPELPAQLEIHGSKGTAIFKERRGGTELTLFPATRDREVSSLTDYSNILDGTSPKLQESKPHENQIRDFIESIYLNKEPKVNGEEGKKSLDIIHSIYTSANRPPKSQEDNLSKKKDVSV